MPAELSEERIKEIFKQLDIDLQEVRNEISTALKASLAKAMNKRTDMSELLKNPGQPLSPDQRIMLLKAMSVSAEGSPAEAVLKQQMKLVSEVKTEPAYQSPRPKMGRDPKNPFK